MLNAVKLPVVGRWPSEEVMAMQHARPSHVEVLHGASIHVR